MPVNRKRRRTALTRSKVVATLGPATMQLATMRGLVRAGVDVFRINYSHGMNDEHAVMIRRARQAAQSEGRSVAILADLQGPKIRVGKLEGDEPIQLDKGDELVIVAGGKTPGRPGRVGCSYPGLASDVNPGERLLIDDGLIELKVTAVEGREVRTRVRFGGPLKPHKGINLPGTQISARALSTKDISDLSHALEHGVDFVALSFVRTAADVRKLKARISRAGHPADVIAKIERPEAVENFDAILEAADGIMVARGDLGVEVGAAAVPSIQKIVIQKCVRAGKPVITATQMLESMMERPTPTRAEASDVANAIYDGTSAVMLSGETAAGEYPVLALQTMVKIVRRAECDLFEGALELVRESSPTYGRKRRPPATTQEACVRAAAQAAIDTKATAIVALTESGRTAQLLARERLEAPVFGCTSVDHTYARLCLAWGVRPVHVPEVKHLHELVEAAERSLLDHGFARRGDRVVFVIGKMRTTGATDTVQIRELGG